MNKILNKKGNSMIGFIVVFPFLIGFLVYIILGGAYFMKNNDMTNVVNKHFDRALIEGQFTQIIRQELINELNDNGFNDIGIEIEPTNAGDTSDTSYVTRGNSISLTVIDNKPHAFYTINKYFMPGVSSNRFKIGVRVSGMSEKW